MVVLSPSGVTAVFLDVAFSYEDKI